MASKTEIEKLIHLSISDRAFRDACFRNPGQAAAAFGVHRSKREQVAFRSYVAPVGEIRKAASRIAEKIGQVVIHGPGPIPVMRVIKRIGAKPGK